MRMGLNEAFIRGVAEDDKEKKRRYDDVVAPDVKTAIKLIISDFLEAYPQFSDQKLYIYVARTADCEEQNE